MSIQQGKASLRILESYPDGKSWVMRVVNRQKPDSVQSLQVRGFALCMLPAARKASVLMTQHTKLLHVSRQVRPAVGIRQRDRPPGLPAGPLRDLRRLRARSRLPRAGAPRLELSYPDPNGWNVRAVNGAPRIGPAADARAYAVCLGSKEGADIRDYQTVYFVDQGRPGEGRQRHRAANRSVAATAPTCWPAARAP